jgi:hypothetical protein
LESKPFLLWSPTLMSETTLPHDIPCDQRAPHTSVESRTMKHKRRVLPRQGAVCESH